MPRALVGCECSGGVRRALRDRGWDAWSCDLKPAEDNSPYHLQRDVRTVLDRHWDLAIFHPDCTYLTISAEWAYGDGPYHQRVKPETLVGADRRHAREEALTFFKLLLDSPIPAVAVENPVGVVSTRIRPPDQTIQPWMFGNDASKATCLWLRGLPNLKPTMIIPPRGWSPVAYAANLPLCPFCQDENVCPVHKGHFADCPCIGPSMDEATYRRINGVEFATLTDPPVRPVWGNQTPNGQNKLGPSPTRKTDRARTYPGIAAAMADQWTNLPKTLWD